MEKLHDAISSIRSCTPRLNIIFDDQKPLRTRTIKNPEIKFVIRIVCKYIPDDLTHRMSLLHVVAIKYSNVKFNY